jgi:ubiquitin C-terminal hydrolase
MPAPTTLHDAINRLNYANKRVSFAWAKYYEQTNLHHHNDYDTYQTMTIEVERESCPAHIKTVLKDLADKLKHQWECPTCLDFIPKEALEITNCGHFVCKPCLDGWKKTQQEQGKDKWECPVCRRGHKFNE